MRLENQILFKNSRKVLLEPTLTRWWLIINIIIIHNIYSNKSFIIDMDLMLFLCFSLSQHLVVTCWGLAGVYSHHQLYIHPRIYNLLIKSTTKGGKKQLPYHNLFLSI